MDNLLAAWAQFVKGKRLKPDVQLFGRYLISNLAELHDDLKARRYQHGGYEGFTISDPKPRHIHKACVRDRVLHHAVYRMLYPEFDRTFIYDSYSCRKDKGTHRAIRRFDILRRRASGNHHRTCWALQCDHARRLTHNAVCDKLRILARTEKKHHRDTAWWTDIAGPKENRVAIGRWALKAVFEELRSREASNQEEMSDE